MPLHTELHFIRMKASYLRALNPRPSSRHLLTCGFVPIIFALTSFNIFCLQNQLNITIEMSKCSFQLLNESYKQTFRPVYEQKVAIVYEVLRRKFKL